MKLQTLITSTVTTTFSAVILAAGNVDAMPPLPSSSQQQSAGASGNSSVGFQGDTGEVFTYSETQGDSYQQITGGPASNTSTTWNAPQNGNPNQPSFVNQQKIDNGFGLKNTQGFDVRNNSGAGTTGVGNANSSSQSGGSLQQGSQWNTGANCSVCE